MKVLLRQVSILTTIFTLLFSLVFAADEKKSFPLDLVIVLDNSGSMRQNDPNLLMKEVVTRFIARQGPDTRLGLVIFAEKADLALPLVNLGAEETGKTISQALQGIDYHGKLTNSAAAVERAIYELKSQGRPAAERAIVFLTDGIIDVGNKDKDRDLQRWLQDDLAMDAKQSGIRIFSIAFTEGADFLLIQSLAQKTGAAYYRAFKAEEIEGIFNDIAQILASPTKGSEPLAAGQQAPQGDAAIAPSGAGAAAPAQPAPPVVVSEESGINTILLGIIALAVIGLGGLFLRKRKSEPAPGLPTSASKPEKIPEAELAYLGAETEIKSYRITKPIVTIGRDAGNDLVIPRDTVSARHAVIEYRHGCFYLMDQRSINHTFLNEVEMTGEAKPLKNGDLIRFDVHKFQIVLSGQVCGPTVSAGGGGTVLRLRPQDPLPGSEPSPAPTADLAPSEDEEAISPPLDVHAPVREGGTPSQSSQGEKETMVKPVTCPEHPSWKVIDVCCRCKKGLCSQCVVEENGKIFCKEHAGQKK